MTGDAKAILITTLSAMPDKHTDWGIYESYYRQLIEHWNDDLCEKVRNHVIITEEYRPKPSKLISIAAEIVSPRPSASHIYREIMYRLEHDGQNKRAYPGRPNCFYFIPGAPPMSCAFVDEVVSCLPSWDDIREGKANFEGGIRKAIEAAVKDVDKIWDLEVKRQLNLPQNERDSKYFQTYKPFEIKESDDTSSISYSEPVGQLGSYKDKKALTIAAMPKLISSKQEKEIRDPFSNEEA